MNKIMMIAVLAVAAVSMVGCTDAELSSFGALGESAAVTCYSGGEVFYTATSTGKVMQLDGSGLAFRNAESGRYVRAFADCIVEEK